jgi:uncharacterized protein (DUF1330 family)
LPARQVTGSASHVECSVDRLGYLPQDPAVVEARVTPGMQAVNREPRSDVTAYVMVEIQVHDPELYEQYKPIAANSIELHGGRYLARGGETELLEGDDSPGRIVILEFPDAATARHWYQSAEYAEALKIRERASVGRMIVVEGLA